MIREALNYNPKTNPNRKPRIIHFKKNLQRKEYGACLRARGRKEEGRISTKTLMITMRR